MRRMTYKQKLKIPMYLTLGFFAINHENLTFLRPLKWKTNSNLTIRFSKLYITLDVSFLS